MKKHKPTHRLVSLVIAIFVLVSPLLAQQRRSAPRKSAAPPAPTEPAPTFDSLLAAESYKVYGEVRAVGGLIRSPAVTDVLDPFIKLSRPPKEFKTLVKWLNAHAEILAGSRMMIAGWPTRPNLPTVLVAIEFSSPEEAKKFYPELRDFLPTLLPTPTPTPAALSVTTEGPGANAAAVILSSTDDDASPPAGVGIRSTQNTLTATEQQSTPAVPPYQMKQAGSLVFISDTTFTFRNLKPRGSKALEEDQNFQLARNRFASESIFVYVDLKSIEKEEKAQQQKWEEERKRVEAEAANQPKIEEKMTEATEMPPAVDEPPPPVSEPAVVAESTLEVSPSEGALTGTPSTGPQRGTDEVSPAFFSLYGALFGGESKWPEAVGIALVLENDAYVVRTLILNTAENKGVAIPFIPQLVSGPAIVPQSPNIFPDDTNLFVSVSLDYPQIYEGMLKALANAEALARRSSRATTREGTAPESPFAVLEKKLGLKIKDDLLPLLGNEMALALPKAKPSKEVPASVTEEIAAPGDQAQTIPKAPEPIPVVAIAVKDREAVKRLLPKLIEAMGFKGAGLLAQTERRESTEITTYAGAFSYAFIEDFLVVSPDAATTRQVVNVYLNRQTLSSNSHFRNFTRWQPHQVLGQVYVGPDLMEAYNPFGLMVGRSNPKVNDFLSRLNPLIEPTTYALSNDGSGPLHELHIPRNLLQWLIGSSMQGVEASKAIMNETAGKSLLRMVHSAETTYQATQGKDQYGSLDELIAADLLSKDSIQQYGYALQLSASGNRFEATAVPIEYGVTGTLSYFIDESGVLRGGDHGGGPATAADQPLE